MAPLCTPTWADPVELTVATLKTALTNKNNVFICFYMEGCPHCIVYAPTHQALARSLHESYVATKGACTQMVVARMNGPANMDAIKALIPEGPSGGWGFPALFFKTAAGARTFYTGERSKEAIMAALASKFGDTAMAPHSCSLDTIVPTYTPGFTGSTVVLYRGKDVWTQRDPVKPSASTPPVQLNSILCHHLQDHPDVASRLAGIDLDSGRALPANVAEALRKAGVVEPRTLQLPVLLHLPDHTFIEGTGALQALSK